MEQTLSANSGLQLRRRSRLHFPLDIDLALQDQPSTSSTLNTHHRTFVEDTNLQSTNLTAQLTVGSRKRRTANASTQPIGTSKKRGRTVRLIPQGVSVLPQPSYCDKCHAKLFAYETNNICCNGGEITIHCTDMHPVLESLLVGHDEQSKHFRDHIRLYNSSFAFTSFGAKIDKQYAKRTKGVYTFKVQGQVYHYISSLLPADDQRKYLQLYFFDTDYEVSERMKTQYGLREDIVKILVDMLNDNPYAEFFRMISKEVITEDSKILLSVNPVSDQRVFNSPSASQVAAIWAEDEEGNHTASQHIIVYGKSNQSYQIKHYYGCYDPLQYPLLFPLGESGWHRGIKKNSARKTKQLSMQFPINKSLIQTADDLIAAEETETQRKRSRTEVSSREYYSYKLQIRLTNDNLLLRSGRLLQQYLVDMYIKIETARLDYLRHNQSELRAELYCGVVDCVTAGETSACKIGRHIILPGSFLGGPRDMRKRYLDAMALVNKYGKPDLFLTVTCNPTWAEITEELLEVKLPQNRAEMIARIFRAKFHEIRHDIIQKKLFGEVAAYVYCIEYKKCGLPHAHILIILKSHCKLFTPEDIDRVVSAKIPDPDNNPHLYSAVLRHMIHGPCGKLNPKNHCMKKNGLCKNHYPKDFSEFTTLGNNSYPLYRRRDTARQVNVRASILDNRWIVPYNPFLLAKYDCHINVEICADIKAVKYLYKYIHKGHDRTSFQVAQPNEQGVRDEIAQFQAARWICPVEAAWRIFTFLLYDMYPSVISLQLHLPDMHMIHFDREEKLLAVVNNDRNSKKMLTEFFRKNVEEPSARKLLYIEFPQHYVWNNSKRTWTTRQKHKAIGRVVAANPSEGERFYLRVLLMNIRGPLSFDHLLIVKGYHCQSFREAAERAGLLESDDSIQQCMEEAVQFCMPIALRRLFATILDHLQPPNPMLLWNKFVTDLSEDYARQHGPNSRLTISKTVVDICHYIELMGKSLKDCKISEIGEYFDIGIKLTREVEEEMSIPVSPYHLNFVQLFNREQLHSYTVIMDRIMMKKPGVFFVDGPGGTGKTFVYCALLANIRAKGQIAIATATSGIAASNLPGGRTAHSRFKLPIETSKTCSCAISKQSTTAELLRQAVLIVWDEVTMATKNLIEAFENMLRDICSSSEPFGGKVIVFGGDFRQVLPVIPGASRAETINKSVVMSDLWPTFHRLKLTQNMRAHEDPAFSSFLMDIGNGIHPIDEDGFISLPRDIVIPYNNHETALQELIDSIFLDINNQASDSSIFIHRAILSPRNDDVDILNTMLIDKAPGEAVVYRSFDKCIDENQNNFPTEYLNNLNSNGLPPYRLVLKKGCPVILLRNIDPFSGLCNGTRLICTEFRENVICAIIATGHYKNTTVFIPRITLKPSANDRYPFEFQRKQFPVKLSYAMSINKAQGQTLEKVGVFLPRPVFSHGQLYVALSRARTAKDVKLLQLPYQSNFDCCKTRNIVWKEILQEADIN